jgi:hypothetical protein
VEIRVLLEHAARISLLQGANRILFCLI